ncbi:TetR/AcrR family transcriptional regulator [Chenggangzhangella methanolivorans]|uniref:TetR/AcrR family transcriptional regulator n=1 Tax=Chenggangzhangella methanolivorans TaxID=1437009 RepID=A0A9E6R919_9HYPH|nr:TetR/AcrR family transcriptional regulator [Chenggangzhangella methanolivorans]QZN98857.1 TetR/AcrR family transcriptional regulator [Chenggangzhangella methanolivorans]
MSQGHETIDVRQHILHTATTIMAAKGFSAVGLNEILVSAQVPKGSFYHYFGSKDAFGEAILKDYFEDYLADLDATLTAADKTQAERLMTYFAGWRETQGSFDHQGKCLAVKLAAEVSDLSEAMRLALKAGAAGIVDRLTGAIAAGVAEGSLSVEDAPASTAENLYQTWLGASLMAKIERSPAPFDAAMAATRRTLNLPAR